MRTHKRKWKESQLSEITHLLKSYPIVAIADLTRFPAALAKELRKKLSKEAVIKVSKTRIIRMAIEKSDKKDLAPYIKGSCALIFTKKNPFELYAFFKKNKGRLAAKEGMIAEVDLIIPAGDTGLPPGPALSDLKQAGLKVKIEGGSIAVTEDKVVAKKGEVVTKEAANALSKLDIKPVKVGINVVAAFEHGIIYLKDILDVDTETVFMKFVDAQKKSFNLAVNISYTTKETMPVLLAKAFREAKAVAVEGGIITPATASDILGKADAQAKALKELVKEEAAPAA